MDSRELQASANPSAKGLLMAIVLLFGVLAVLFHNVLWPGYTLFSNDGPLGTQMSQSHAVPDTFSGGWQDLNSVGFREGGAFPGISYGLLYLLGPVGYSKFFAPLTLLILGLGAWCFFRQLRLAPLACVLGALAAALNSGFFSGACWGVAAHPLMVGLNFFALALLYEPAASADEAVAQRGSTTTFLRRWIKVALAGLAVGMGVMEAADIGAIFSMFVATFVIYQAWTAGRAHARNLASGVARTAVVALFAGFIASQAISVLVETQVKGVVGTQQDQQTKEERWDFATQWSLPKREALSLVIPGLFGFRMDTPEGGNYWGAAGRDPAWYRYFENGKQGPQPGGFLRFTGGGNYAGILVVLLAVWAAIHGFRKGESVFADSAKRWLWFWSVLGVGSLLLAFGRFAPFYRILYALPYFSTIRNPAKFLYGVNWAEIVLFAYGVHGLWTRYMARVPVVSEKGPIAQVPARGGKRAGSEVAAELGLLPGVKAWWQRVRGFDRRWTIGCIATLGLCVLGWLIYSSSRGGLEQYLQEVGFDAGMAKEIAGFSIVHVGWFLLFFSVAVGLMILALSGGLSGRRAKWGGILLGLFLVVDLGRANQPWIITWDYVQKYATNPIIDFLRNKPYEHRVALLPFRAPSSFELLNQLYRIEWAQHHFLYYNVQSLDVVQMPRVPADLAAFEASLMPGRDDPWRLARRWQLTNTRYLIGAADFLPILNQQLDPAQQRFKIAERFQIVPKPGESNPTKLEQLTAMPATNGPFAVFEFTGALPRAKLYGDWQVTTNDLASLEKLSNATFDPEKAVLVAGNVPPPGASTNQTSPDSGTVDFEHYAPKDIALKAKAARDSVLLLNDKFDPNWNVTVDGKAAPLLRCNYLMQGVYVPAGAHTVEFKFQPPMRTFYVSLMAVCTGLLLSGLLLVVRGPAGTGSTAPQIPPEGAGERKDGKGRELAERKT